MSDHEIEALIVTRPGGREVLEVRPTAISDPDAGQLLVRVAASGVNFVEVYQREGIYRLPTPFVLGGEGAGTVIAVGPGVSGFEVGQLVCWAAQPGSHAQEVLVGADKAVAVPEGVQPELAAAALLQGMTAHYLITSTYSLQPGDSALVHAAAGGVGQLLVQLAKSRGALVIATAGSDAKCARARELGADEALRYDRYDDPAELAAAIRAANGGRGVSVVYDGVGQATFDASLASLTRRGVLALFGASSGPVPPVDPQRLNQGGSLFLTRPTLGDYIATRDELLWRSGEILTAVADGTLAVEIGGRYPLHEAAQAYDDLENRRTQGKLVLLP
ncbi:MAG: quinone oxidoreductase [Actinobacteria bacterium]|nr:quinone oxidoreductase [Actinomycetota bacterium]